LATATFGLDNSGSNKRNITIADKGAWLAATSGNTLTVSGVISTLPGMSNAPVTFGVASSGTGTVNLTGNNIYTGTTTVAAGTLLVNGTNSGGGAYTVASGGTLGGSGSIVTANSAGAAVLGGGRLSPGNSPGVLSMDLGTGTLDIRNAITPVNSQSMLFDLDTPATSDQVKLPNAASSLTIGNGNLAFDDFVFTPTANFGSGDYTLFDTNNTISGFFDVFVNLQGVVGGYNAELQMANNNQDIVLHVTTPVPEPSTALLLTLGGLGLLACRRKG
jgi:autotransporter-associated beta strand protein